VGETRGKRKIPWAEEDFYCSAFPFEFRDLCCINECKFFAQGHSQYEELFFLNIDNRKKYRGLEVL